MQEKSNIILNQEETTPKCKTSPNCDSTVKKQFNTRKSKLNAIIDSITFQTPNDQTLDQENRAPSEMSSCDSEELLASSEMVETHESDDSASDAGAIGNFWSNKNNKQLSWRQNKRKQSRPQRCSTYLRDRNNSLDSAIDVGDPCKDSDDEEEDFPSQPAPRNGCHVVGVATDNVTTSNGVVTEENGNDCKYVVTSQTGLPCVFRIQPNEMDDAVDSPNHSDLDSYVITENDMDDRENSTPSADSEAEASTDVETNMDNVINIEPMDTESAVAAASKRSQSDLEPGEVVNMATQALTAGGLSLLNQTAALQIPSLTSAVSQSINNSNLSGAAPTGRTPLRHRRTIGELYGLMNPQRRGRGGATNHIAMKYRRDCPIPGCGARYLTNLCDHLKKTHGLGPEERRPWLEKAKRIHQQKQLQEQQQQLQSSNSPSSVKTPNQKSQQNTAPGSLTSSASNSAAAAAAANLAASPALAAIALATSQSTANLSSTDSIAMAMSQIPLNSAALLMQQAQALSLLNAQAFPNPGSAFPGFPAAVGSQRPTAGGATGFPSFSPLGAGTRMRSPWNNSGSRKNCPVPGCGAKSLLNLSDHLSKVHSMTRDERQPWLQRARDEVP